MQLKNQAAKLWKVGNKQAGSHNPAKAAQGRATQNQARNLTLTSKRFKRAANRFAVVSTVRTVWNTTNSWGRG